VKPLLFIKDLLGPEGPRVNAVIALLAGFTLSFATVWLVVKSNAAMGTFYTVTVSALATLGGSTYIAAKVANKSDTPS
jgi:hypothetical protein